MKTISASRSLAVYRGRVHRDSEGERYILVDHPDGQFGFLVVRREDDQREALYQVTIPTGRETILVKVF